MFVRWQRATTTDHASRWSTPARRRSRSAPPPGTWTPGCGTAPPSPSRSSRETGQTSGPSPPSSPKASAERPGHSPPAHRPRSIQTSFSGAGRPSPAGYPPSALPALITPDIVWIADCSDLGIVPTWAWIGLSGKGSAARRSEQSQLVEEGEQRVGWRVAAGRFVDDVHTAEASRESNSPTRQRFNPPGGLSRRPPHSGHPLLHLCIGGRRGQLGPSDCSDLRFANALTTQAIRRDIGTIVKSEQRRI
jgi:hypothetical protein